MAAMVLAAALILNSSFVAGVTPSTSTNSSSTMKSASTVLYLDIGASVSVGVQPTPRAPKGQPTNRGYANRLVAAEAAKGVALRLTQLGCPGESIASMIHGPDPCYVAPDTQLSDAVVFLRAHHLARTLVTIDLGFNTLNVCFNKVDIDLACVNPHLVVLGRQLTQVLRVLTRAAGANVSFIGLGHYNPYLTKSTKEGAAEIFAGNSVIAMRRMNQTLRRTYRSFNVPMADVAEVFKEEDTTVVRLSKKESTTANVVCECRFTWMCAAKPFGPNIHPTDAGYQAITKAIVAVLPANL
ncbi:MAG TPA: SGNH/GDSL hydrolase family protein [Acidimicrobiales bacterium]|nr:SGNH/GDSL hydrolase family protein [Acidimicrobiales bacterium]